MGGWEIHASHAYRAAKKLDLILHTYGEVFTEP